MSDASGNGKSNGSPAGGAGGAGSDVGARLDPFGRGVWLLTNIDGFSALAMVEGSDEDGGLTEAVLISMLEADQGPVKVDLRRKYIFPPIFFPVPVADARGNRTGQLLPGSIPGIAKHEQLYDFSHEFPTHKELTSSSFTLLSEVHPDDVAQLRESVHNVDRAMETHTRAKRSNIVMPSTAGVR